jgi:DNA-binding LacI/PurR family transcriptional regulator/anti-anti-sigma regulatory factor
MIIRTAKNTIGILLPDLIGTYCRNLLAGVYRVARQQGQRLIVIQAQPTEVVPLQIAQGQVDGWIAVLDIAGVEAIVEAGIPLVTVSQQLVGASAVLTDNVAGMYTTVSHLIAQGHERIAFVYDPQNSEFVERFEGYKRALANANLPFDQHLIFSSSENTMGGGRHAATAMLSAGISFSAIAAVTDHYALGVMARLQEAGYRFPIDLAIVGFDDIQEAQVSSPPLTTVRQSFEQFGRTAALQLLQHIADPALPPEALYMPATLIIRHSSVIQSSTQAIPTDTMPQMPLLATSIGDTAWHAQLARTLVEVLQFPRQLPSSVDAAEVWPGVNVITATLEAGLYEQTLPEEQAIQQAWIAALELMSSADATGAVLDVLERAAEQALAGGVPADISHVRSILALIRNQLLRVCIAANAQQLIAVEQSHSTTDKVTAALAATDIDAKQLHWLANAGVPWACFGVWNDQPGGMLTITGTSPAGGSLVGQRFTAAAFPPLEQLPTEVDVVSLVAVRTNRHNWGMLAFATTYRDRTSYIDSSHTWAGLLGARLDDSMLVGALEQQQEVLQGAYERERALANTVRELGCPTITLGNQALLVPLIGFIDSHRAKQIIEVVLQAVSAQPTQDVLLDVRGVPIIDTHVASVLIQLAQMLALLGARTMLIGVRPEIAQSIISLGVDLRSLNAHSSLEHALATIGKR